MKTTKGNNGASVERLIRRLHLMNETVWLQKMSSTTFINDLDAAGRNARIQYGPMPWRCRIGRHNNWHYAATAEKAMAKALPPND